MAPEIKNLVHLKGRCSPCQVATRSGPWQGMFLQGAGVLLAGNAKSLSTAVARPGPNALLPSGSGIHRGVKRMESQIRREFGRGYLSRTQREGGGNAGSVFPALPTEQRAVPAPDGSDQLLRSWACPCAGRKWAVW